ncbi:hypothetical protein BGZ75_007695 [Mortierella antarctica]|nr:hypothetical protein BGZ67_001812 [Mortierella alpina]KAF9981037.1 hypothetical protein BGZ75_007695 [Mortierella antarctica]
MLCSIRAIPIAAVMLCLFGTALSAPANTIGKPLNVVQGGDPRTLLHDLATSLDQGSRPEGWERLMHTPETNGTSGMEILSPANLQPVVESWGIDESMYNRTLESINNLIHTAIGEGIYAARGFTYTLPKCMDKARPVCLTTLIVAARVQLDAAEQEVYRVELGHIYMKSGADSIEQPGRLTVEELGDIESVLNSLQSKWALDHVPVPRDLETPKTAPISLYSVETKMEEEQSSLEHLLEQIIENNVENKDVFKDHKEELLEAIQEATEAREQSMNNMQLIVSPKEVPRVLQNALATCFKAAGMKESVSRWWARVYPDLAGKPISVECSAASQRKDKISPPRHNCTASSNVTTSTSYSWVMIAPKGKGLEVVLLENQVDVNFMDCDLLNDPSDSSASIPDSTSTGAVIRWASVQPDGSFKPVQYLNSWSLYPENIDKAMMDILRYDTATGYLNVITPETSTSAPQTQRLPEVSASALALSDNSKALLLAPRALPAVIAAIDMIVKAIGAFAETWEKVAKAFSSGMTKTIQRRVCLGFDAVDFHADSFVINGVARNDVSPVMEELANIAELPKEGNVRSALVGMKYSTNFTWTGENMIYRDQAGNMGFLFLGKQGDAKTGEANLVYSRVTSNFKLAEDMLLVRRQISVLGGIWKSDTTEISHVPHTFTPQDTQIMQMFWQMIAFRQMAMSAGIEPPKYPDLSFLCDRSIKDSQ